MLADVVRGIVSFANAYTGSVQEPVYLWPWVGVDENDNGQLKHADVPIQLMARVDRGPEVNNQQSGQVIEYTHRILFMSPLSAVGGAEGRQEPIDPRDKIVLRDGATNRIIRIKPGDPDPATGLPFDVEVWLGVGGNR